MKKNILGIFTILAMFGLASCDQGIQEEEETFGTETIQEQEDIGSESEFGSEDELLENNDEELLENENEQQQMQDDEFGTNDGLDDGLNNEGVDEGL